MPHRCLSRTTLVLRTKSNLPLEPTPRLPMSARYTQYTPPWSTSARSWLCPSHTLFLPGGSLCLEGTPSPGTLQPQLSFPNWVQPRPHASPGHRPHRCLRLPQRPLPPASPPGLSLSPAGAPVPPITWTTPTEHRFQVPSCLFPEAPLPAAAIDTWLPGQWLSWPMAALWGLGSGHSCLVPE